MPARKKKKKRKGAVVLKGETGFGKTGTNACYILFQFFKKQNFSGMVAALNNRPAPYFEFHHEEVAQKELDKNTCPWFFKAAAT